MGLATYKYTKDFPQREQYGIVSQMRRSSISVSANIAEGYERQHRKEYVQYLTIARGSLGELETYLLFSRDLGYFNSREFEELNQKRQEVGKLLNGLIKSLSE
ncbi:MAG: four helix bundle protein [Candidatus Omnitrophica bacterium]|nr:four helix bundle protein [Candidatus Omnitrophota bacterium]